MQRSTKKKFRRSWLVLGAIVLVAAVVAAVAGVSSTSTAGATPKCADKYVKAQASDLADAKADVLAASEELSVKAPDPEPGHDMSKVADKLPEGTEEPTEVVVEAEPEPLNVVDGVVQRDASGVLRIAICDTVVGDVDGKTLSVEGATLEETGIEAEVGDRLLLQVDENGELLGATNGEDAGVVDELPALEEPPVSPDGGDTSAEEAPAEDAAAS